MVRFKINEVTTSNTTSNNRTNHGANLRNRNLPQTERNVRQRQEGYNSDDERGKTNRSIVRRIDDEGIKGVTITHLKECLSKKGLQIVTMPPDGNCLFHSVADQIYGDHDYHDVVRKLCLEYMERERNHFSQFITEDFNTYIARKRKLGVFGNHLELQAITEIYSRPVEIFAVDENPLNIFQGSYEVDNPPIMLSYHYGNHYNSVRDPKKPTAGFGLGLPGLKTAKETEEDYIKEAIKESEQEEISKIMQSKENDFDNVEESLIQMAKRESEAEYNKIHDNMEVQEFIHRNELEQMQEEIERAILEQSLREYYSRK